MNQINIDNLPKITVVTPSYNQGKFLRETIESVLNQNYPNLEYFIIDGGSTDESVDIIREYENRIDWWVSTKDKGQSDAINKGFRKATGDLFNWINSDDIFFPGALHRIASAYERNPDADIIVGSQARSDERGKIFHISCAPSQKAISPENWVLPFGQQSTFLSSKAVRRVGGLRENLHAIMDTDLYYRILIDGGVFMRTPGMIGMIRTHPEAKGEARKEIWLDEIPRLWNEYRISRNMNNAARLKMRIIRCLDRSYLNSFFMLKQWRGKSPW